MIRILSTLVLLTAVLIPHRGFAQFPNLQNRVNAAMPRASVGQPAVHEPFSEPITAAKIRTAIDDAVMYLRNCQTPAGSIGEYSAPGGGTGLAALAMLAAGADPAADDQLNKALDWLAKQETNNTYVRGIRANVWEYALRKAPYDARFRNLLKTDFEWLMVARGEREGWRYTMQSPDWDNSCTQYGVLGLWAAARAGFEPGDKFWIAMSQHFRSCQGADGGWGYQRSFSTPNMATAGLASLFLVFDMYHARHAYRADKPDTFTQGEAAEVLAALDRGMTWLGKAQGNKADGYYLYGIERTGVAGGRKYIGGEDWFARGADAVLKAQRRDGSIPLGQWGGPPISTAFCTMFLVYGGAPLAMEKLRYGEGQDWNLNPRDVANLSKFLWSAYERPMNWQVVSVAAKDQFESPILFISGAKPAHFTEEQMLKLREYILGGGTILAEPSDHSREFAQSMEELVRLMFPKRYYPDYELKPLPPDHGIYTVVKQNWKSLPRLRGVSDGSRTFFLLSDEYLAADWQTNRSTSDAFNLATNLLFYATDLGEMEGKFASVLPNSPPARARKAVVKVARVRYEGDQQPFDWDAASQCWKKFAPYVQHVTGGRLEEVAPVRLGVDPLDGIQLLHVTGRNKLVLTEGERAALKRFVAAGGTLLVDAYAGSPVFAASARAALESLFGPLGPLSADHPLAEGRFEGGADLALVAFKLPARQLLRRQGEMPRGQRLLVARVKNHPAVFLSAFDLTAAMAGIENYRSAGYRAESARKIVGNLVAWLMLD